MKTYNLHIDSIKYKEKPPTAGRITKEIAKNEVAVTPIDLEQALISGQTVVLATMQNGERTNLNMIQQQIVMLDFDNVIHEDIDGSRKKNKIRATGSAYTSLQDIMVDSFIKENASFIYTTFSHTNSWHKFRVVFFLDVPLTTEYQVNAMYEDLLKKFPTADNLKDPAHLFYGGTHSHEIDFNNVLAVPDNVLQAVKPEVAVKAKESSPVLPLPKPIKVDVPEDELLTWQLIRAGRKEDVKDRLKGYGVRVHSKPQAMTVLKSFNMIEFLGLKNKNCFDLFHYEENPSASVFKMENADIWLYKCHSASEEYTADIIRLTSRLLGTSFIGALNYLIEVTGITIVMTEQVLAIREQCDVFSNVLTSNDLRTNYPNVHFRFGRYVSEVVTILSIFKENVYEDSNGDIRSLSWYNLENLAEKLGKRTSSKKTVERLLNLLCLTSWIDKLQDSQIPTELLKKLKSSQDGNKYAKRGNVFELLLLDDDFFEKLERECFSMKQHGFTMKGFSREMVIRTFGIEMADKVFVQDTTKTISIGSDKIATSIHAITLDMIEKQGYAYEKDIYAKVKIKWKTQAYAEIKFKRCLGEMLDLYDLKIITMNNACKAHFGLDTTTKSYPKVIVKADFSL